MKIHHLLFILAVLVSACAPEPGVFQQNCTEGEQKDCSCSGNREGTQVCDNGEFGRCECATGSGGSGAGGGAGGSGAGGTGAGGSVCVPTISCKSVGAECGVISDDGCGNEIVCEDNCQAPLTCGGGGDQFKCGCPAQTCLDLGLECGVVDDGCGNAIDCGGCNPRETCGGGDLVLNGDGETNGATETGEENRCGGGCAVEDPDNFLAPCQAQGRGDSYFCVVANVIPFAGCTKMYAGSTNEWCCQ